MKPTKLKLTLRPKKDAHRRIAPAPAPPSNPQFNMALRPRPAYGQYGPSPYSTEPPTEREDYSTLLSNLSLSPIVYVDPQNNVYAPHPPNPYVPGPMHIPSGEELDTLARQYRYGLLGTVPSPYLTAPPTFGNTVPSQRGARSRGPRVRRNPSTVSEANGWVQLADMMDVAPLSPALVHDHFWDPPQEYPPPCEYTFDEGPADMPGSQAYYKSKAYKQRMTEKYGEQDVDMDDADDDGDTMDIDMEEVKTKSRGTTAKARGKAKVALRTVKASKVGKTRAKVVKGRKRVVKRDFRRKTDFRQQRYETRRKIWARLTKVDNVKK
ncbi:hypothetical protein P280DRAFT_475798 [Massarina eburnea CBS 473.64]|uniref:Uncharacterized protein n=1 Tax=Massarina eburnea CBS 473.64 TaxID=1395130 RepID=A0A6A6SBI5_9PLEO|nr:hypothetical protein P280DRAFT_475798 [Massarina eburnea CBS 473.64]